MFKFLSKILDSNERELKKLQDTVIRINAWEDEIKKLTKVQLKAKTVEFKERLKQGESLDDLLPEAFAVAREAINRVVKQRAFDVQLIAAIAIHQGKIAEQKTGEGKTLSSTIAVYLNALSGQGAHIVTVNDYLARRDSGWYGEALDFLGLKIGVIYSGEGDLPASVFDPKYINNTQEDHRLKHLKSVSRREAYACDVTYGTNNEFGFDYLRDNMAQKLEDIAQRSHHFAIIDEVDSILIDEARTPLIISAPDTQSNAKYIQFKNLINELSPDTDYEIDEKIKSAQLTEHGIKKIEKKLKVDNLYEKDFDTIHHIEQALRARSLFHKDKEYVVKDNQIIIVDEHTGRLMHGRRYSEGLHQAIEASEGVEIQKESRTLATISLQNYFRMYQKLAGMTGTAVTEAAEFKKVYDLDVVVVPTNRPLTRQDHNDLIYKTMRAKYAAVVAEVERAHRKGQPVLIGTRSIEQNQIISKFLNKKRISHNILNAKNHLKEAEIIAQAGRKKAVTVATNMAGRGVDIVLGGDPTDRKQVDWKKEHEQVKKLGGLFVVGSERHESRRIDNQLRGRSGRQGDLGASRFYVSLEDELMRVFGGEQISKLMTLLKVPENEPIQHAMVNKALQQAQAKIESFFSDQRKQVVEYDDVANEQRNIIYKLRRQVLSSDKLSVQILEKLDQAIDSMVIYQTAADQQASFSSKEAKSLIQELQTIIPFDPLSQKQLAKKITTWEQPDKVTQEIKQIIHQQYEKRQKNYPSEVHSQIEHFAYLTSIDQLWMDHLSHLDQLRDGIRLRGYAQKDPLVEYKKEAFNLFESLVQKIDDQLVQKVFRIQPVMAQAPDLQDIQLQRPELKPSPVEETPVPSSKATGDLPDLSRQSSSDFSSAFRKMAQTTNKGSQKAKKAPGRNSPCPCGSGKKYKKCCYLN